MKGTKQVLIEDGKGTKTDSASLVADNFQHDFATGTTGTTGELKDRHASGET